MCYNSYMLTSCITLQFSLNSHFPLYRWRLGQRTQCGASSTWPQPPCVRPASRRSGSGASRTPRRSSATSSRSAFRITELLSSSSRASIEAKKKVLISNESFTLSGILCRRIHLGSLETTVLSVSRRIVCLLIKPFVKKIFKFNKITRWIIFIVIHH